MEILTIGHLAQKASVNIETVRYYERRGLLPEPPRSPAGYRQYSAGDLWRLQFIARAKRLGFTLAEVGNLLGGHDHEDTADSVALLARTKIEALDVQRRTLEETRGVLAQLIDICGNPTSEDCMALRVPN